MKRVIFDENLCQGTKECASIAAQAVTFASDGIAEGTDAVIDDDTAERMVSSCPSMAITAIDA
ncbi:hypothetical protein MANY_26290 [Mycolicibacterium anyangense]|uniref:Ferredoxin n=1 Tax=Mycolicibacterium anyangense TaxID=1431246 RepID=A0A6N4WB56_9MYCO|nr:hypothetical protein MANY_26290 [Mycolicibacterium anyangense]